MRVLVWVDAGPALGLGHLSRCLALADALGARGARCRFALAPDAMALGWLRAAGQRDVLALPDPERALADVLQAVRDADAVVVDVKRPLERHEVRALRGSTRVLVIDNPGPGVDEADLVVAPFGTARDARWLVGAEWLPLRTPTVRDAQAAADGRTVLVSMGGSDPGGLSAPVIDALGPIAPRLGVIAVVNPLAPVWRDSTAATARWGFAPAMPTEPGGLGAHLAVADLAVLAFGVTVYEAMASGVPSVVLCRTSGDVEHARVLENAGAVVSLGAHWKREDVTRAVTALVGDPARRGAMARAGRARVDGLGAARVAARLLDRTGRTHAGAASGF